MRSAAMPQARPATPAIAAGMAPSTRPAPGAGWGSSGRATTPASGRLRPRQRELDERGVRGAARAPGGPRLRLPEIGRAGDVEVDPGHGGELAEEEAALHEPALAAAAVDDVAVPRLHLGQVLIHEGHLPLTLAAPPPGGGPPRAPPPRGGAGGAAPPGNRRPRPEAPRDEVAQGPRHRAGER